MNQKHVLASPVSALLHHQPKLRARSCPSITCAEHNRGHALLLPNGEALQAGARADAGQLANTRAGMQAEG